MNRDEVAQDIWEAATGSTTSRPEWAFIEAYADDLADNLIAAGYRKVELP